MMRASRYGVWALGVVAIIAGLIAAACTPIAPLAPTDGGATESAALVMPDPGDDWARIQARGEMIVGTSANYPPFEYFDESFGFDGFDPALARAIGAELGVNVVFRDIAFDGLGRGARIGTGRRCHGRHHGHTGTRCVRSISLMRISPLLKAG